MILLDGRNRAQEIRKQLTNQVAFLHEKGVTPRLNVILIGDDAVSKQYIEQKRKAALAVGIEFELFSVDTAEPKQRVVPMIKQLIEEKKGSWIVQLPIPQPFDEFDILDLIPPAQDVDCLSATSYGFLLRGDSKFTPPTPAAIIDLLETYQIDLRSRHVVIVGAGRLVGKPLWAALIERGCTITTCTGSTTNLKAFTTQADILISAVGKPRLISADMVKNGAVVIDAATSAENGAIIGDIDPNGMAEKASALSPVPGGVGPVTVAKLLEQVVKRAHL